MCKFPRTKKKKKRNYYNYNFFLSLLFFFKKNLEINMFNFLWVEYIGMMSPLDGNYFLSSSFFLLSLISYIFGWKVCKLAGTKSFSRQGIVRLFSRKKCS